VKKANAEKWMKENKERVAIIRKQPEKQGLL
jgi:post-segregation antitoxin (ccd killing protein)